jgi:hypothetical protein
MLFHKFRPEQMKWLLTDMTDSALCKAPKACAKAPAVGDDQVSPTADVEIDCGPPAEKKQKRVSAKAKAAKAAPEQILPTITLKHANGGCRPKCWLDDVLVVTEEAVADDKGKIDTAADAAEAANFQMRLLRKRGTMISMALQFCWTSSLELRGASHSKWTACRSAIKATANHTRTDRTEELKAFRRIMQHVTNLVLELVCNEQAQNNDVQLRCVCTLRSSCSRGDMGVSFRRCARGARLVFSWPVLV